MDTDVRMENPHILIGSAERAPGFKEAPKPMRSRQADFERLDTRIITAFPPALMSQLKAQDKPPDGQEVCKLFEGDEARTIDHVCLLLYHTDIVDLATRIDIQHVNPIVYIPAIEHWKNNWKFYYDKPDIEIPEQIFTHSDLVKYLRAVLPMRPGPGMESTAKEMYTLMLVYPSGQDAIYDSYRSLLVATTEAATHTICNAARVGLELSLHNPDMEKQVVSSISHAIESQDKWWVMGTDEPPPIVQGLFKVLAEYKPEGGAAVILDTLYRKADMDPMAILSSVQKPADMPLHEDVFHDIAQSMIDYAIQFNPEDIQAYLADKYVRGGVNDVITELIITRRELHSELLYLGTSRTLEYFGKEFIFDGLPSGQPIYLRELTFGMVLAETENGDPLGLYQPDPSIYVNIQGAVHIHEIRPENLLFWNTKAKYPIPIERLRRFYKDYPHLKDKIASYLPDKTVAAQVPLAAYFQMWEYMENQPRELAERLDDFLEKYQGLGIVTLISGEQNQDTITKVVKFGLDTYRSHIINSYTSQLLREYSDLSYAAWKYAVYISKSPDQVEKNRNLILQRAKALLLTAANRYDAKQELSREDLAYLYISFRAYSHYLDAFSDPSGVVARQLKIPYEHVQQSYRYFDPEDSDSREVFYSLFDLWFETNVARQELADYHGNVEAITTDFYQAYEELEQDAASTTADPVLEYKRYLGDIAHDFGPQVVRKNDHGKGTLGVGFLGAGKLRMEKHIIEDLKARLDEENVEFFALDLNLPPSKPPGVSYLESNMAQVGNILPNRLHRIYSIWSPIMDELELEKLKLIIQSIARAAQPGCAVLIDNHFPFGEHSYESIMKAYNRENPAEPEGMMERSFERNGKSPLKKRFFASDPMCIIPLSARYGLRCVNLPSDPHELLAYCQKASQDDSFIGTTDQSDLNKNAVYRTSGEKPGWNRITYKFVMADPKPDIDTLVAEEMR